MNKLPCPFLVPLACALAFPLKSLAADVAAPSHNPAVAFIYTFLPLLMIGLILWWFLQRSQRSSSPYMRRSLEYYERSEQHMQKMEQIGGRIAAALEARDERSPKE